MKRILSSCIGLLCLANSSMVVADITVPMYATTKADNNAPVGSITFSETQYGLLITPHLHDLKPGMHGLHIHQNPSCEQEGMEAGGHFDPGHTNKHLGPYDNQGHLGDLPAMFVDTDGTATLPILAPRLRHLTDIQRHALMVHEGGDNYSDIPSKLGGGGARMECGIIQ
jgi:Cu-Zn family superoxide dismutase